LPCPYYQHFQDAITEPLLVPCASGIRACAQCRRAILAYSRGLAASRAWGVFALLLFSRSAHEQTSHKSCDSRAIALVVTFLLVSKCYKSHILEVVTFLDNEFLLFQSSLWSLTPHLSRRGPTEAIHGYSNPDAGRGQAGGDCYVAVHWSIAQSMTRTFRWVEILNFEFPSPADTSAPMQDRQE
jgi:hypothetical protein